MEAGDHAGMDDHAVHLARYNAEFRRLVEAAHRREVSEVEGLVRDFARSQGNNHLRAVDVALMARFLSDSRWLWKHPLAAIALAWRHRASRAPHRSLLWLARPRLSG